MQEIFKLYCKLGCVKRLKTHLDRQGLKTRIRTSRSERKSGGGSYSRGALYHLLKNRIYLGEVPHKGQCYPGIHEALISRELWDAVQTKLKENAINRRFGTNATEVSLLKGLVCDANGTRYTPSHAVKNGKRYRYYTAQRIIKDADSKSEAPGRIPASDIEDLVVRKLKSFLTSPESVSSKLGLSGDDIGTTQRIVRLAQQLARKIDSSNGAALTEILSTALQKVALHATSIELHVRKNGLRLHLLGKTSEQDAHIKALGEETLVLNIAAELKRCRGEKRIVLSDREPELTTSRTVLPLVKAVTRAHEWARQLASGECKDLQAISERTRLDQRYVSRILPLAFLIPEMIEAILDGRQHPGTTIDDLRALALLDWPEQRSRLRWLEG